MCVFLYFLIIIKPICSDEQLYDSGSTLQPRGPTTPTCTSLNSLYYHPWTDGLHCPLLTAAYNCINTNRTCCRGRWSLEVTNTEYHLFLNLNSSLLQQRCKTSSYTWFFISSPWLDVCRHRPVLSWCTTSLSPTVWSWTIQIIWTYDSWIVFSYILM